MALSDRDPALERVQVDQNYRPIADLPADAPRWALEAIAQRPDEKRFPVGDRDLEILDWGDTPHPGMLLVHGHGAHADWWRVIAPQMVGVAGRVVAMSLGGMGGSEWRDHYSLEGFGEEVAAVAGSAALWGPSGRPWLVAHSFGCVAALIAAEQLAGRLAGIVLIDFYLPPPGRVPARGQPRKIRFYDSLEAAMSRFILSPPQDSPNPFLVDFVGRRTLRRNNEQWTWCTDPAATIPVDHDLSRERLRQVAAPLTIVRGARSGLVDEAIVGHLLELAPRGTAYVEIPDADHHILLDQPLALVAMLRTLLAAGKQERPHG